MSADHSYLAVRFALAAVVLLVTGCGGGSSSTTLNVSQRPLETNGVPHSSHVVLLVEENRTFAQVYPSGMPWLASMGNSYALAANYHDNEPGSLLDYLWLSRQRGTCVWLHG